LEMKGKGQVLTRDELHSGGECDMWLKQWRYIKDGKNKKYHTSQTNRRRRGGASRVNLDCLSAANAGPQALRHIPECGV